MPLSKKHLFTEELQLLAGYGHVVSHPARIVMVRTLAQHGCLAYSDLVRLVPLSETAVSNHLRTLERHGLVYTKGLPGQVAGYALRRAVFEEAAELLANCLREEEG